MCGAIEKDSIVTLNGSLHSFPSNLTVNNDVSLVACEPGFIKNGSSCVRCPYGTEWTTSSCRDCPPHETTTFVDFTCRKCHDKLLFYFNCMETTAENRWDCVLLLLSFEWNLIRLGGPAHGIVTKTLHKTLPRGGGGQVGRGGGGQGGSGWWGQGGRGWWGSRGQGGRVGVVGVKGVGGGGIKGVRGGRVKE